jgi:hypothetical protein
MERLINGREPVLTRGWGAYWQWEETFLIEKDSQKFSLVPSNEMTGEEVENILRTS